MGSQLTPLHHGDMLAGWVNHSSLTKHYFMAYMLDLLQHRQEGPERDGGISSQHKGITCNMGLLCRRQVTLHLCYMDTQIPGKVFSIHYSWQHTKVQGTSSFQLQEDTRKDWVQRTRWEPWRPSHRVYWVSGLSHEDSSPASSCLHSVCRCWFQNTHKRHWHCHQLHPATKERDAVWLLQCGAQAG